MELRVVRLAVTLAFIVMAIWSAVHFSWPVLGVALLFAVFAGWLWKDEVTAQADERLMRATGASPVQDAEQGTSRAAGNDWS